MATVTSTCASGTDSRSHANDRHHIRLRPVRHIRVVALQRSLRVSCPKIVVHPSGARIMISRARTRALALFALACAPSVVHLRVQPPDSGNDIVGLWKAKRYSGADGNA